MVDVMMGCASETARKMHRHLMKAMPDCGVSLQQVVDWKYNNVRAVSVACALHTHARMRTASRCCSQPGAIEAEEEEEARAVRREREIP
jgi:hypothetical protein